VGQALVDALLAAAGALILGTLLRAAPPGSLSRMLAIGVTVLVAVAGGLLFERGLAANPKATGTEAPPDGQPAPPEVLTLLLAPGAVALAAGYLRETGYTAAMFALFALGAVAGWAFARQQPRVRGSLAAAAGAALLIFGVGLAVHALGG
jgi:hypothetical protein